MSADQTTIGERIHLMRIFRKMTVDALGGSSRAIGTLVAVEKGELQPTARFVSVMAGRLNCPRDYLAEGVPEAAAADIRDRVGRAESAVRAGVYAQGLEDFAALLAEPATAVLPDTYDRSLLGYASAQETAGRYHLAVGSLQSLRWRRTPGDSLWVASNAAAARCSRLDGDARNALSIVETSIKECPTEIYARYENSVPLRVEHVAALAAHGKHSRARAAASDLVQVAHVADDPHVRVHACWAVAYAALARGDDSEAVKWAKGMYRAGMEHRVMPPVVLGNRVADLLLHSNTPDAAKIVVVMLTDHGANDISLETDTLRQINLIRARVALGNLKEAANGCRSIITNFQDLPPGLDGEVLTVIGDEEMAEEHFSAAADIYIQAAEAFEFAGLPVKVASACHKAAKALVGDGRHAQANEIYRYASGVSANVTNIVQYEDVAPVSGRNSSSSRRSTS